MTDQGDSFANRLLQAGSPRHRQQWEKDDGYYVATCRVSPDDIPRLIEIACKWSEPDWLGEDLGVAGDSEDIDLLPVVAWRTLADLRSAESIEPLIGMLCDLDDYDDWSLEELPHVFGKIGEPAIAWLVRLANDAEKQDFVRGMAAEGLQRVAEYHPETRAEVVAHLAEMMTKTTARDIGWNSNVLVGLVELHAVEAAESIERAFSMNALDVGMIGDWEAVRTELGVEGLRLEMPKHPFNSIERFRTQMGIGVFSAETVFSHEGQDAGAEEAYYERALRLFSQSQEAEQVVGRYGGLRWVATFLDYGIQHLSEIVDTMTSASVEDFLFDYVPRKVSTEADSAASIVFELTKFWEYVQRVFDLPAAKSIVEWLETDGLVDRLETALADPANYGMAKSLVMAGKAAGYDMTSQQGIANFMAAYNQTLLPSDDMSESGTIVSRQPRIGRNEPCPCGSGKKYKKCCLRGS